MFFPEEGDGQVVCGLAVGTWRLEDGFERWTVVREGDGAARVVAAVSWPGGVPPWTAVAGLRGARVTAQVGHGGAVVAIEPRSGTEVLCTSYRGERGLCP